MDGTSEEWWHDLILKIQDRQNLTQEEVRKAWNSLWCEWKRMDSSALSLRVLPRTMRMLLAARKVDPLAMLIAPVFLVSLFAKGLTEEEMLGFMRSYQDNGWFTAFQAPECPMGDLIYTNGFGGDQVDTINVSTPAAIIAVAAGAKVLKMGSHSYFGRSGAQDFTDEIGIRPATAPEEVLSLLNRTGVAYIDGTSTADASTRGIAQFLSGMPHGKRLARAFFYPFRYHILCFNFLNARIQHRGISTSATELTARLLLATIEKIDLGHITAGMDRDRRTLDEVSNVGQTKISVIRNHQLTETFFTVPSDWGVRERKTEEIVGGSPVDNVRIVLEVMLGRREDAYLDLLTINASQLLYLGGVVEDFKKGTDLAKQAVAEGKALETLQSLAANSGGDVGRLQRHLRKLT